MDAFCTRSECHAARTKAMQNTGISISRMPDNAACLSCGYALQGLTQPSCPECGQGFDPTNRGTYTSLGRRGWIYAQAEAGPGWVIATGCMILTLLLLYASSVPGGYFGMSLLGIFLGFMFGAVWLVRMLAGLGIGWKSGRYLKNFKVRWRRWLTPVLVALIGMGMLHVEAPMHLRLTLAQKPMATLAQQCAQTRKPLPPTSVWGMHFDRIEPFGVSGTLFFIDGAGFLNRDGWAYLSDPADQPATPGQYGEGCYFYPFSGDWYRVVEDY